MASSAPVMEFLYSVDVAWITLILFASMAAAMELSYRLGRGRRQEMPEAFKSHVSSIQSSILGVLALLLGFTFSLSLQRFDTRSSAVVDEANTIRTVYHESILLPDPLREEARGLLRDYVDARVGASRYTTVHLAAQAEMRAKAEKIQQVLWDVSQRALESDRNSRGVGQFISSLSAMVDGYHKRIATLERRVPEEVLLLLYVTFVMAGAAVGFASGVAGHRPSIVSWIMVGLICVLVFVIMDLDRPRRGLIRVNHGPLHEVHEELHGRRS
jgi:hypothetical protein